MIQSCQARAKTVPSENNRTIMGFFWDITTVKDDLHVVFFSIRHQNVNIIRIKFEMTAEILSNFNIFLIPELKLDSNSQFKINSYKVFRHYQKRYDGVLLLYVNKCSINRTLLAAVKLLLWNFFRLNVNSFCLEYKPQK